MLLFKPEDFIILIVDDMRDNVHVLGNILENEGYGITFALNGQEALNLVESAQPDLILLDLMMPEMDGLEVCERLKASSAYQETPVIFLTASCEMSHLLKAFEVGAVDYITKPFIVPELLARVKTHLELKYTRDQLKKALEEQHRLAITDPLTGVYNRRYLFDIVEREFKTISQPNRNLSILLIDIDHFKRINDLYGHPRGDEALKALTQVIQGCLRKTDCLGRLGGEEFLIFLSEANLKQAAEIAERIRQIVTQLLIPVDEKIIKFTVSIGVATYHPEDRNFEQVLNRADQALYQAKGQGRDRVITET